MMKREPARGFGDLLVWQRAHAFVLAVYRLTSQFPKSELYGLTSQMRRAAVSIAANIAEGFKRRGKAEKVRFFNISQGSLEESRYYLILAQDLEYGECHTLDTHVNEISRLLESYMHTIQLSMSQGRS